MAGYAIAVRRYAKMVRKVVRKKARRVPAKNLPALAVRKKVRNQKLSRFQIRNRYAGCVPIRRLTHFNPGTSRRESMVVTPAAFCLKMRSLKTRKR